MLNLVILYSGITQRAENSDTILDRNDKIAMLVPVP